MRNLEKFIWAGLLVVVAVRPWVLEFVSPERVPMVQWVGLFLGLIWLCLTQPQFYRRLNPWLAIPCSILLLSFLVASFWSHDRNAAFLEGHALVFGIVLMTSVALANHVERRMLLWTLIITGLFIALHALWQVSVIFPALADIDWNQVAAQGMTSGLPGHTVEFANEVIARGRAFGPFPIPGLLAAALGLCLPLSVAILKPWATTAPLRIFSIAVWGIMATALLLTQSLGGVLSICAATLLVLILRRSGKKPILTIFCITIVTVGTLFILRPELSDFGHKRNPIVQRWRYWTSTARMISDHPIRGIGAGNYSTLYPQYKEPQSTDTYFAHNAFLHVWAEWGALGLIGLLGLLVGSLLLSTRKSPGYQIAIWTFWIMATIDIAWSIPQLTCLWWPLLGLSTRPSNSETHV